MDAEMLEKVLMDRALGGATPETLALVEAYLEKDAEARERAAKWERVAGLARRAVEGPAETVPAFPRKRLAAVRWRRRAGWGTAWGAGMAACLAVGWILGERGFATDHRPAAGDVSPTVAAVRQEELRVAAVKDFWSEARLRAYAQESRAKPANPRGESLWELWLKAQRAGG